MKIIMDDVVSALFEAGYNPKAQILAYLKLNNPNYITKYKNARDKIKRLNQLEIEEYLLKMD